MSVIGSGGALLAEFRREIRRLHGCAGRFECFVTVPEAPGRPRQAIAVFALEGHPAGRCYAWKRRGLGATVMAVLEGIDVQGAEDAVRRVREIERASQERWAQEYA